MTQALRYSHLHISLRGDNEAGDGSRRQSRHDASDEGADGELGDIACAGGGQLGQNADLDSKGSDVAEAAQGISGNEFGTGRHVGLVYVPQSYEGRVLVLRRQGQHVSTCETRREKTLQ